MSPWLSTASVSLALASSRNPICFSDGRCGGPAGPLTVWNTSQHADRRAPLPIVAIVGATASGKTGLSLDLATELGGEIVNTDAMQVYRGMDVGTAKLPPSQRRGIEHHLLDRLDVTQTATVADFQGWAREEIADIRGRGRTPVLVGGSALYTRAILDRFEFPGTDESVRRELEAELARARASRRCTSDSSTSMPRPPRRSAPTTAVASCARSR